MDRRRYTPSAEGLEGRALLSLFGGVKNTAHYNTTVSIADLPKTYKEKELRIAHLPYYLAQEDPRRFLPPDAVYQLQTDMNSVVSKLHAPTAPVVNTFNAGLRRLMPNNNLSPKDAKYINHLFGAVLERAGATPQQVNNLQDDMNALALVDSKSIQPSTLARGDYSLVLQTTLAVGRPMITPAAPVLMANDGTKVDGGRAAITHDHNPTMVGTYEAGATKDSEVWVQIVDRQTSQVIGSMPVGPSGTYSIKLNHLDDGTYFLSARSSDEVGHLSEESNAFKLTVKTAPTPAPKAVVARAQFLKAPPGGPLSLSGG